MEEFETYLRSREFSQNSIDSYLFAVAQLLSRIDRLGNAELLKHKDWLVHEHSAKTANTRITSINCYLDFVGYEGLRLKSVKIQQKPFLDDVISNEEYEALKRGLKRNDDLFWLFVVRFLACTGARVSELRQFTVAHVKAGYMDLISKGQKLRRVYIPSSLQADALVWCENRLDNELIFATTGNEAMTTRGLSLGLKRAAARYGVNPDVVYPHSFRHLFAKNFIARNPDIAFLADLMGHESIETTRIYLRRTASEQRAAVDEAIDW